MNGIVNITTVGAHDGAMAISMSASRGILALQGIGLSPVGAFGDVLGTAKAVCVHRSNRVLRQDKTSGSWHPAAIEAAGAFAFDAGYEQAFVLPELSDEGPATDKGAVTDKVAMQVARPRTADQAIVIRNRHRCRSR
ncbi:hypothetical protein [Nocardia bovistercoris]|uniref:Uncharacterized protein n=1 Tax=Nocardia bovistercoris TaxID=2785916 RepID=A0A931I978_9NOCA|nr:hypothetical protein [Nocardia bovistercoris]MBH0775675.1 hypothetical protein [Nocardia bovistercoris]